MIPRLCAIVDADLAARAGWTPADLAQAYIDGGARLLQLRAKNLSSAAFLETAAAIATLAHAAGAMVVVNDRADIARLADADGVHVGQDDLEPGAARGIVGRAALVGLSTHSVDQVERAIAEPISYVAMGPVFGTTTKDTGYEPVGLEMIREAAHRVRRCGVPLVAIGGITLERAPDVLRAGADSVAIIGDLLRGADPTMRVREYLEALP